MPAPIEHSEYAAFSRRIVRAYGRRLASGADPEDLAELVAMRAELDAALAEAVAGMRENLGCSWADIARATGTTRQAAQQRWSR